ncbi:lithostathine-1-beta-like [Lytechinus pictus]|uniref:lithostathine-1-beta-like n=1 Tax=Lytechinus pictus TaxID=7653 RepID=UPI0030B9D4DA
MYGFVVLVISSLLVGFAKCQCPSPWEFNPLYPGYCYYYNFFPVSWSFADQICQFLEGGDLVSIDDSQEGMAIYEYWGTITTNPSLGYWIGLTDIHGTGLGRTKWTDWTSIKGRTNWQGGAWPNDTNANCAYVTNEGASDDERRQWKAASCESVLKPAICERKLVIN